MVASRLKNKIIIFEKKWAYFSTLYELLSVGLLKHVFRPRHVLLFFFYYMYIYIYVSKKERITTQSERTLVLRKN